MNSWRIDETCYHLIINTNHTWGEHSLTTTTDTNNNNMYLHKYIIDGSI